MDAFQTVWSVMSVYALPLLSLILQVLSKLAREPCQLLLIAPYWPNQPWSPGLTRLLAKILLYRLRSVVLHPNLINLHLTC